MPPGEVTDADVLSFIAAQRQPRRGPKVVRIEDGEAGLSARTIKRRLASVTGLFEYLIARGVVARNPVPRGLPTRTPSRAGRGVPLIRTPRTLPRMIDPDEADALMRALRTHRDRAMVQAMLLGVLRRCEVLGLRHTPAGTVCGSSTNKRVLTSAHIAHSGDGQGVDSSRCNPGVVTDRIDSSIAAGRWPAATWFDASSA
jgi:site-specific recombinase XerD